MVSADGARQPRLSVMDSLDLKAFWLQVFGHQRTKFDIVVNYQDAVHRVHCSCVFPPLPVKNRQIAEALSLQRFTRIDALFTATWPRFVFLFYVGRSKPGFLRPGSKIRAFT